MKLAIFCSPENKLRISHLDNPKTAGWGRISPWRESSHTQVVNRVVPSVEEGEYLISSGVPRVQPKPAPVIEAVTITEVVEESVKKRTYKPRVKKTPKDSEEEQEQE